jgi:hypothetical protein
MNDECPLTKTKTTFVDALARLLVDESLAIRVNDVEVATSLRQAVIRYDGAHWKEGPERATKRPVNSIFAAHGPHRTGLLFSTTISGDNLRALAKVLK